jgi:polyisoprenoid-binding protein YceI
MFTHASDPAVHRNNQTKDDRMTRTLLMATLALALPLSAFAADETYVLDSTHSQPMFEVSHMTGFSLQRGVFSKSSGTVVLDRAARKGSIDVSIDTASVRSLNESLDTNLKGENFFNVTKYPTMTFKSSKLLFDGDNVVGAEGELTMIGVTKPVTVKVANFMCGEQPFNKKPLCGAEVTANIKRSEWGMKYGIPKSVGDEVKITIPVEAYRES